MRQLNEDVLGGIFNAVDFGLILLSADRRVVAWNAWMAAASGLAGVDAIGKRLGDLFPDLGSHRLNSAIVAALELGASSLLTHSLHPSLFRLRTRAGRELIHDVSVRPTGDKPFSKCLIQIVDVTVSALRERVLRERQDARYAAVVDNAPDAILTIDAEGTIQFANAAAAREFGCRSDELVGRPAGNLFADRMLWDDLWLAAIKGEDLPRGFRVECFADGRVIDICRGLGLALVERVARIRYRHSSQRQ